MADELAFEKAMAMARSLTTIEGFPRFEDAILATANDLMDWCRGAIIEGRPWSAERQAAWLVAEARLNWRKWTGTGDFLALFCTKFPLKIEAGNEFHQLGLKPPVNCPHCNDNGTVRRKDGWSEWCYCEQAIAMRRETPGWLDLVNRHLAPKPRLVTQEDVPLTRERLDAMKAEEKRMVQLAIDGAENILHDPRATKEEKKTARRLLKLYRPKTEGVS
jgi:hypothetical protein